MPRSPDNLTHVYFEQGGFILRKGVNDPNSIRPEIVGLAPITDETEQSSVEADDVSPQE